MSEYCIDESLGRVFDGDVTAPDKYKAIGVSIGLKKNGTPDMGLIYSSKRAIATGVFTESKVKAAPVLLSIEKFQKTHACRAVIVNSGNANACTGRRGRKDAESMVSLTAELLDLDESEVVIASTGRIGEFMPMNVITSGVKKVVASLNSGDGSSIAESIMTTDTKPKEAAIKFEIGGKIVTIGAVAKGAGMIAPKMSSFPHATMLAFITTDAFISPDALDKSLFFCTGESFNKISVDGDMSTNDTVVLMANGAAENREISLDSPDFKLFQDKLLLVMKKLARDIVLDAEGATKFVTVKVINATTEKDAVMVSEAVANSLLCKTAWFGCDPNWGRIIAAAGYSGACFNSEDVSLYYDSIPVVLNGCDAGTPEEELSELMSNGEFTVLIDLSAGDSEYEMWTCDLSYEYVKINADYHT